MKYIDIKKDALRLMGVTPINVNGDYSTTETKEYVVSMNDSILRAIDRICALGQIPPKTYPLPKVATSSFYTFSKEDFEFDGEIKAIKKLKGDRVEDIPFVRLDDKIYVYVESDDVVFIEYYPYFNKTIDDNAEVDLPDGLARIIPYFVKADLYEDEEPQLAALSRNLFEKYLEEYSLSHEQTYRSTKVVYGVD